MTNNIINKTATTIAIILTVPFASTLCINLQFSMYMLFSIIVVGIIWAILHMWFK